MVGQNDAREKKEQRSDQESQKDDQDFVSVRPAVTVLQDEKQDKNAFSKFMQKEKAQKPIAKSKQTTAQSALPTEFLERRRRQKRKKLVKIGVVGVVAAAVVLGGVSWYLSSNASDPAGFVSVGTYTEEVTRGDLELTVEGSGTLAASATANVSPEYAGTVSQVSVEVGDEVKEGQALFTMTSDDLQDQINAAAKSKSSAYSSYTSAKSSYSSALSAYNTAKQDYNQAKKGADSATSSTMSPQASDASGETAAKGVEDEGPSAGTSSSGAASSNVTQAQQALSQAERSLTQAKQQKSQAWEQYEEAASAYEEIAAEASKLTVAATMSGTVTQVNVAKGDQVGSGSSASGSSNASSGATASTASSSAAVVISDESSLSLTVQVDEGNINQVKKGQTAQVTVTALEEQVDAKVVSVARTASSSSTGSGSSSVAYYDVDLTISNPSSQMRQGMNATAVITSTSFSDVLLVPVGAVTAGNDKTSTVTVLDEQPADRSEADAASGDQGGESDQAPERLSGQRSEAGEPNADSKDSAQAQATHTVEVTILGQNDTYAAVEPVEEGALSEGDKLQVTYKISNSSSDGSSSTGFGTNASKGAMSSGFGTGYGVDRRSGQGGSSSGFGGPGGSSRPSSPGSESSN